jgi:hypothetical protein
MALMCPAPAPTTPGWRRSVLPTYAPGDMTARMSQLVLGRLESGFRNLTDGLIDPALRGLRPASRQGIYAPLFAEGGLVDITSR